MDSGSCLQTYSLHSEAVRAARWSPCGQRILSGGFDSALHLTDLETGVFLCFITPRRPLLRVGAFLTGEFLGGGFCSRQLQTVSGQGQTGRGETHTRQACLQAVCLKPRLARRLHSGPLPTCPEDRVPRLSQPQPVELDRGGFLINF